MNWIVAGVFALALGVAAAEEEVIFRSDVSLVRVDVQVLDRNSDALTRLEREDFVLREQGREVEIRNFAAENMPVDILLLLDVSGSMRPHLEQVARASRGALSVLGREDRVGVMVFDRATRLRAPFRGNPQEASRELDSLLDQESFNGGTDITRALVDAARYVERNARAEARRAIVIVTDDQTEFERDETRVGRALASADAVLSVLVAPAMAPGYGRGGGGGQFPPRRQPSGGGWPGSGGTWPGGGVPGGGGTGGGWPGGGGGWPGGGGGPVIIGPGGGGGRGPTMGRTRPAGTEEIARDSGGDSLILSDGSAVERTLRRIRSRYALYFLLPEEAREGESRMVDAQLSAAAARRYAGAEVKMRRRYVVPKLGPRSTTVSEGGGSPSAPAGGREAEAEAAEAAASGGFRRATAEDLAAAREAAAPARRKRAVSEPGARGPNPGLGSKPD